MKVQAQIAFSSRLSSDKMSEDEIKHRLAQQLAIRLLDSDMIKITKRPDHTRSMYDVGFDSYYDHYHGHPDDETYTAEIFVNDRPFHRVPDIPDYTYGGKATQDNITLTPREAEKIWKLLPPRINGIKDSKHPLNPHWFGTITMEKDVKIKERIKQLLKINE